METIQLHSDWHLMDMMCGWVIIEVIFTVKEMLINLLMNIIIMIIVSLKWDNMICLLWLIIFLN
jgi:hypothetical protein